MNLPEPRHYISHFGVPRFVLYPDTVIRGVHSICDAHDLKYDRPTLVKTGGSKSIEREAKVYTILGGMKGIPRLYNWCAFKGIGYLSMQRCGMDLKRYLHDNGPLSLKDALRVAVAITDILSTAHAKGVIPCDIKPENVVCSPDNGIWAPIIIDWGLAAVTGEKITGTFGFTLGFASVSLLRGNAPHALDDFESLVYVVEYLVRGSLPWSHFLRSGSDDYSALLELQEPWIPEDASLRELLRYTQDRQEHRPVDYEHIKELLRDLGVFYEH